MMEASLLLSPEKLSLLQSLDEKQQGYFKWFLALTEIPHGTTHCEQLSQKIQEWIKFFGYEPEVDSPNNIVVRIPSNSDSDLPVVALQAHIDMVLTGDIKIDEPVSVEIVEQDGSKVIRAPKSTLGADDGFGVAVMLELLEKLRKSGNSDVHQITHGPLEFIFTTDEEICLVGIRSLPPPPFLKFKYLINMDSLKGDKVYIGCCGGCGLELKYDVKFEAVSPEKFLFLRINLKGLHGGHSGMCINKGNANSIKWIARILSFLHENEIPYQIVKIDAGSNTKNAIPTQFDTIIAIPKELKDTCLNMVHEIHTKIMFEYFRVECTDFFTDYIEIENPTKAASVEQSWRFTDLLMLLPNGVQRMSPQFPDTVQSSISISKCYFENDLFEAHFYARSSCQSQMELILNSLNSVLRVFGGKYELDKNNPYPAWEPKTKSNFAKIVQNVYKEKTGNDIQLGLLQVGVEPSMFNHLGYTDTEKVAICPSIPLAHAVGEWMDIEEAIKWRDVIHLTLTKLCEK
ncbi:Clan MH, family M20, peptidase T-like metallopeptidase [Tritrichomonas foetus]|uniref:Clan MH, family M20, peptidase T-like metallopeptidase n=1 Tax=Tritrichomonas foetus TaxID=1144522 RepID=A0A1J4KRY6_9EUKA|nr:Clan MH, family M20, peptidase T-like metallopeptidase [Tritrichomonas foetus]|eukprot:OHT12229.1 Clan MH, family M20, peptidase T-like metallopeptidase [Tritrichomonas foetus]